MYVIQNALKSITRSKGRNILIGIIALIIALSGCLALSIRQAAETAREDTLSQMSITAQINFDRAGAMKDMAAGTQEENQQEQSQGEFKRESFDFDSLSGETLTLEDYMVYTQALSDSDSYYYTMSSSLNASEDFLPYGESETEDSSQENTQQNSTPMDMGGGKRGMESISAQGDFSITGFSSYSAMMSLFGEDGTMSITDGEMFEEGSDALNCVISDELALYNDISVGDTIIMTNPNYEDESYQFTVCGIYTNSSSDMGNSMFSRSDPANNIYMTCQALEKIIQESEQAGNTITDDSGDETDASLKKEISFTYSFSSVENYENFTQEVYNLGLGENYSVTSQDLAAFENSLTPLNTLSNMAGWFFLVVLIVGGAILVVLNIFNLRERKYEIGVLAAIGMKKQQIAMQFVVELFCVTLVAFIIGTSIGACVSVPVTNQLLENQTTSRQSSNEQLAGNFGLDPSQMHGQMGNTSSGQKQSFGKQDTNFGGNVSYIKSVTTATDFKVVLKLLGVGIALTIVSSLAAVVTITRYEPLKILSNRA